MLCDTGLAFCICNPRLINLNTNFYPVKEALLFNADTSFMPAFYCCCFLHQYKTQFQDLFCRQLIG